MKKNLIAVLCGLLAAVVLTAGTIISMGSMKESESIGASSALSIALHDAGVSKAEAKNTKSVFEKENRRYIFDVEFSADGLDYDYDIDASTGEILKREAENNTPAFTGPTEKTTQASPTEKPSQPSQQAETTTEKAAETPETTATAQETTVKYIGLERAKQAALKRAGFSSGDVRFTKAKLDYEDGTAIYEIEFIKGNTEYEFEIAASNGKILDFERESLTTKAKSRTGKVNHDDDDDDDLDDDDDEDDED